MNLLRTSTERTMRAAAPYRPDLVAAAEVIAGNLRERRAETDRLCRLPDSTAKELQNAGLFDILKPLAYGGQEASFQTLMDCVIALARGDGAVGWTVSLLNGAAWGTAAFFGEEAASPLFSSAKNVHMAGSFQPRSAKVRRVPDGVVIENGVWPFASGIRHASWVLLGLPIFDEAGQLAELAGGAVPVSDIQILDDWDTIGLRGTGSNSVSASGILVPNARIIDLSQAMAGSYASEHLEDHALYRMPLVPFFFTKLAFTGVGIAKAVLDEFVELAARRGVTYTPYEKQNESTAAHLLVGEASAKIECAELLLRKCVQNLEAAAVNGLPVPLQMRTEIRRDAGYANKLTIEAVDMLVNAAGASFALAGHPLNRLWRDARVASLHAGINPSWAFELYGRVRFGLDPGTPMV